MRSLRARAATLSPLPVLLLVAARQCAAAIICANVNQTDCVDEDGIKIGALDFTPSQTWNFSIILVSGGLLVLFLTAFHVYYWLHDDWSHGLRAPFPDATEAQRADRTCRKFLRVVMLHHPISCLLYAGKRDGFNRPRRVFCIFVALGIQLTVTYAFLLTPVSGWGAALIATAASFVYEKPIVRLVQFTGRQRCFASCANCCSACGAYMCVCFCIVQIPLVFVVYAAISFGPSADNVLRENFSFTTLLLAWAASVLLSYVVVLPKFAALFCLCPARYTEQVNEYSRQYEGYGHVARGATFHHSQHTAHTAAARSHRPTHSMAAVVPAGAGGGAGGAGKPQSQPQSQSQSQASALNAVVERVMAQHPNATTHVVHVSPHTTALALPNGAAVDLTTGNAMAARDFAAATAAGHHTTTQSLTAAPNGVITATPPTTVLARPPPKPHPLVAQMQPSHAAAAGVHRHTASHGSQSSHGLSHPSHAPHHSTSASASASASSPPDHTRLLLPAADATDVYITPLNAQPPLAGAVGMAVLVPVTVLPGVAATA